MAQRFTILTGTMAAKLRELIAGRLGAYVVGVPLGATIFGAGDFLFEFPDPLPYYLQQAQADERVQAALGQPIVRSVFWEGCTKRSLTSASVPLYGPKGSGVMRGRSVRAAPDGSASIPPWQHITLDVTVQGTGAFIDLIEAEVPEAPKLAEGGSGPCSANSLHSV